MASLWQKTMFYLGLVDDLFERRDKVLAACEALAPHLANVALTTADPAKNVPVGLWMHRGGVPFVSQGFAVLHNTAMPVVGEGDAEPNDTFVEQLVMKGMEVRTGWYPVVLADPDFLKTAVRYGRAQGLKKAC